MESNIFSQETDKQQKLVNLVNMIVNCRELLGGKKNISVLVFDVPIRPFRKLSNKLLHIMPIFIN